MKTRMKARTPTPRRKTKLTKTYKLGEVKNQPLLPDGSPSPFTLSLRDVGWHPDASVDANYNRVEVFIEEAIGRDKLGRLIPFPVPKSKNAQGEEVPFSEPR